MVTSISSSIDVNNIVEQLMQIERRPLTTLQAREATHEARISLYGQFLGMATSLRSSVTRLTEDATALGTRAVSSNTSFLSASVTNAQAASPGTYDFLLNRLATSQSLASGRLASGSEPVAELAPGVAQKMRISLGGSILGEISINDANNSLSGIAQAVNNLAGRLTAQVVNDGQGQRLVLTASDTGAANRITVEVAEDGVNFSAAGGDIDDLGLSRLAFSPTYNAAGEVTGGVAQLSQVRAGANAIFNINGLEVERGANEVTDLIPGVTLNLLRADAKQTSVRITVAKDTEGLRSRLNAFVQAYNQLQNQIKTSRDTLQVQGGDSTMGNLRHSLRNVFAANHGAVSPAEIGLSHDRTGVLNLDLTRLEKALTQNEGQTLQTIASLTRAMGENLDTHIKSVLPARQEADQQAIRALQNRQIAFEQKLLVTQANLRKKYSALEEQLNRFQQTSDFLTRQMDALTKSTGGK